MHQRNHRAGNLFPIGLRRDFRSTTRRTCWHLSYLWSQYCAKLSSYFRPHMKDKSTDTPVSIDPVGDMEEDRGYRTRRPRRQKERNYGNFVDLDDRHYGPLACPRPEGRLCVSIVGDERRHRRHARQGFRRTCPRTGQERCLRDMTAKSFRGPGEPTA
jgi:hypothetical protein